VPQIDRTQIDAIVARLEDAGLPAWPDYICEVTGPVNEHGHQYAVAASVDERGRVMWSCAPCTATDAEARSGAFDRPVRDGFADLMVSDPA
jgi:hypothetical protein